MRIIVYGVGAIGGVVAGGLVRAGRDCIGIARGARLKAIAENGLRLRSPDVDERVRLSVVSSPAEIDWRPDDFVLLCMKGQHTQAALEDLRAAGVEDQPIFCTQNGVDNERSALRYFADVHAVNVILPCEYDALDEAVAYTTPNFGYFDIGRYPSGTTEADEALAAALEGSGLVGFVKPDAMQSKFGKLIVNLGNIVEAALGRGVDGSDITEALRAEARAVLAAAGIAWRDVGQDDPRRALARPGKVDGAAHIGSSSTQSLARGAGSIETDYLNGEVALLGRLHDCPAPLNAKAARIAARLAREKRPPGSMSRDDFRAALGLSA